MHLVFTDNQEIVKTVKKLQEQIEKQIGDGVISDSTTQSIELKLLWERCGDQDVILCTTICQALVEMVRNGKADFTYILKGLLSAVPSARCLTGIVQSLCDMLVLQLVVVKNAGNSYKNLYSIRHPPHPFISVLTSRPDSWLLIQHQVQRLLSWPIEIVRQYTFCLSWPYIKFVLLEPVQSPQFTQCHLALLPACLKSASQDEKTENQTLAFFLDILPCLQIKTVAGLGDTTHFLMTLVSYLTSQGRKKIKGPQQEETARRLVMLMISLSLTVTREGTSDPVIFIDMIEDLTKVYPEAVTESAFLVAAVDMLCEAPSYCQLRLLQLVKHHLAFCHQKDLTPGCHVHTLLLFPLLNLITSWDPFCEDTESIQRLTAALLSDLEIAFTSKPQVSEDEDKTIWETFHVSPSQCDTALVVRICGLIHKSSPEDLSDYLQRLNTSVGKLGINKQMVPVITAVFCMESDHLDLLKACLQLFETIATKLPAQEQPLTNHGYTGNFTKNGSIHSHKDEFSIHTKSLNLLPVLLYKMNKVKSPQMKLDILSTLPKLATHKISMGPILRTLQLIGGSPKLKALSIRLITSLWRHQDRCFPYLQQELMGRDYGTSDCKTAGVNEVMLAKAASMRDICQLRPHQHGEDLVQPMSAILNDCMADSDAPIVSLVLEGLYYLCEEEVIDIRTTWAVLSGKLKTDSRPLMIQGLCKLFSLVPALAEGQEEDFKSFKKEVVSLLWNYVSRDDAIVVNTAFASLSKFKPEDFHISYLPKKITSGIIEAALAEYPEEFEIDENCLPAITGDCYTQLLKVLDVQYITGFQKLLTSLVRLEIKEMPRGIHHSANRRQTASANQNKALTAIPQFLHSEYEQNKQPGLRQGLAAGLLFGFDPSVPVGRDGKPRKQHLVQFGKQYYQMLYTLINEVSIQPTEWHRTMVIPQAWSAFMDRCYIAYIDCRKAELELQVQQGKAPNLEDNELMQHTAWLWARDKLTDLIKSCSKGSPTSQGNSLSALVGLAVASSKYFTGLSEESMVYTKDTPEHLGQTHWIQMVANTLLAVMEFGYQPQGRIFAMCQQKTQADRTPGSLLARSAAAASLSQMLPVLIPVNADMVYPILDLLCKRLPQTADQAAGAEDPGVIQWFYGLGLGATLAALFEEKFLEVSGVQGMLAIWKAVDALETSVFSSSDNRMGSVLGLGLCLSAMCKDGKPDTKVRLCRLQEQLWQTLEQVDKENTVFEALCVTLACVTASAYAANILTQDVVDRTVAAIYTAHINQPQIQGTAVGLGAVCSGLLLAGHPTVKDLVEKLFDTWITQIKDTDDAMIQIAAIQGAVAIAGPDNCIMQIPSSSSTPQCMQLGDLVKTLTQTFSSSRDLGLQACVPWLLGHLYLTACAISADSKSTVPASYHYLADTSVIRACTDLLIEAGKAGPEVISTHLVHTTLCALNQGATQSLPPVNWPAILSPIMRMSFGQRVETECVLLAVRQSGSSPTTAMFLATWLLSPLYDSLRTTSKELLLDSLPVLIKTVPPAKLELYLKEAVVSVFNTEEPIDEGRCQRALGGLHRALAVHDPPQSVTSLLHVTLEKVYSSTALHTNNTLLEGVCQCFKEIPDTEVDRITNAALEDIRRDVEVLFTRCCLVGDGCQPLTWLNQMIELFTVADQSKQKVCAALLCNCLLNTDQCQSEFCHVSPKMQWLLELMGYIKGLLTTLDTKQSTDMPKITEFLLHTFGCVVVAWSPQPSKSFYAMKFFSSHQNLPLQQSRAKDAKSSFNPVELWDLVEETLPSSLCALLDVEPWKQMTMKIIDWLIDVIGNDILNEVPDVRSNLKSCLYMLRHSKDFQKINTWSRAYSIAV